MIAIVALLAGILLGLALARWHYRRRARQRLIAIGWAAMGSPAAEVSREPSPVPPMWERSRPDLPLLDGSE